MLLIVSFSATDWLALSVIITGGLYIWQWQDRVVDPSVCRLGVCRLLEYRRSGFLLGSISNFTVSRKAKLVKFKRCSPGATPSFEDCCVFF